MSNFIFQYFIKSTSGIPRMNELAIKWFLIDYLKTSLKKYCSVVDNFHESKIDPIQGVLSF